MICVSIYYIWHKMIHFKFHLRQIDARFVKCMQNVDKFRREIGKKYAGISQFRAPEWSLYTVILYRPPGFRDFKSIIPCWIPCKNSTIPRSKMLNSAPKFRENIKISWILHKIVKFRGIHGILECLNRVQFD